MEPLSNILSAEEYETLHRILAKLASCTIDNKTILSYHTQFGTIEFPVSNEAFVCQKRLKKAREFYDLARQVRLLQKEYFKTRDKGILAQSKLKERELDAEIERVDNILNPNQQLSLWE